MRLPELSALQFAALSLLFSGEKTARQLRRELEEFGGPRTKAAFSQLMQRMRRAVYVDAVRGGRAGRDPCERCYRLTDLGLIVWEATRQFYAGFDAPPTGIQTADTIEAEFADHPPSQRAALVKEKMSKVLRKAFMRKLKATRR